jgi:hypothetical protein
MRAAGPEPYRVRLTKTRGDEVSIRKHDEETDGMEVHPKGQWKVEVDFWLKSWEADSVGEAQEIIKGRCEHLGGEVGKGFDVWVSKQLANDGETPRITALYGDGTEAVKVGPSD